MSGAGGPALPELSQAEVDRFGADPCASFAANLAAVTGRIERAARRAGRQPESVRLLPVSKTVPPTVLRHAYAAGIRMLGENKVQEAAAKHAELSDLDISWCVIGHLQSNKAKALVRFAAEFHALDSLKLAALLDRRLAEEGRQLDIYVQVNTSGEETKFGLPPDAVLAFAEQLHEFPRLKPRGLMTLAVFSADPGRVRPCFHLLRRLRDEVVRVHDGLTELSMGMSGDFELAIEEGADVVRVGQAIFGRRPTPDSAYWPGFA